MFGNIKLNCTKADLEAIGKLLGMTPFPDGQYWHEAPPPKLVTWDELTVQPMSEPVGHVFDVTFERINNE